jgi:hypothetical protein
MGRRVQVGNGRIIIPVYPHFFAIQQEATLLLMHLVGL